MSKPKVNINQVITKSNYYAHLTTIPKMDDIQLLTFVKDYLEGCIFTTYTLIFYKFPLHPLIGDIFDPIKQGALSKMDRLETRNIGQIYEYFVKEDPYNHVVYDQMELPTFRSFNLIHKNDWTKAKLLMRADKPINFNNKLIVDLNDGVNKDSAFYKMF